MIVRDEATIDLLQRPLYGLARDEDEDIMPSCCVSPRQNTRGEEQRASLKYTLVLASSRGSTGMGSFGQRGW